MYFSISWDNYKTKIQDFEKKRKNEKRRKALPSLVSLKFLLTHYFLLCIIFDASQGRLKVLTAGCAKRTAVEYWQPDGCRKIDRRCRKWQPSVPISPRNCIVPRCTASAREWPPQTDGKFWHVAAPRAVRSCPTKRRNAREKDRTEQTGTAGNDDSSVPRRLS